MPRTIYLTHTHQDPEYIPKHYINFDYYSEHLDECKNLEKWELKQLKAFELGEIWEYLDDKVKGDSEMLARLPCYEHYNRPEDQTHIDGPPPPKYKCWLCNNPIN